jgi:hypothetical protein
MIPRTLTSVLYLTATISLLPPSTVMAQVTAVTANSTSGAVVGPANLWDANAAAIAAALSLGTAAESDVGDFATAAQGVKADSAVQPAGNTTFTGNNTFARDLVVGNVTYTAAQDAILTITVNGTAAELVGESLSLPDGNIVELIFNSPDYYWTDENYYLNQGNTDGILSGSTATSAATALRSWLTSYAASYLDPLPAISGSGVNAVITYDDQAEPGGWATSDADLLPFDETQEGNGGGWSGTMQAVRLFNADNGKLYRLKITGTPNPVITLEEVTE